MHLNNPKKRISIIGTVGIPHRYGGYEMLADVLVKKLSNKFNFIVFCSSNKYKTSEEIYLSAKRKFIPLNANGWQSIPYDIISILMSIFIADTLLILGVSGCIILPVIKLFHRKQIIVSIDGMEWKRNKWSVFAKRFLRLSEYLAIRFADKIIADNHFIQEYIKVMYNRESTLIKYGGDQSVYIKPKNNDLKEYPWLKDKYALVISRIELENNSGTILETFSKSNVVKLVYIGTWGSNKYSRILKHKYKSNNNIVFINAIYNTDVINLIRSNCTIYIHGHSVGGTNPSLVEAMYVGLPIIAFDINFNRKTMHDNGLFFNDADQLKNNLLYLLNNKSFRNKLAKDARLIALENYKWKSIIKKYEGIL